MGLFDAVGSFLGGGAKDTKSSSTTSTTPWGGIQPYLTDLFKQAQTDVAQKPMQYYPNATVAGFTQPQQQAQQGTLNYAQGYSPQLLPSATGATNWLTSGAVLSPESNPYLAQTAEAAIRPVTQALTNQVLPQIQQQAQLAGQFGGGRQGVQTEQAIEDWLRQAADTSAGIFSTGYGQGLDALQRGAALAPGLETAGQQSGLFPYTLQSAVGGQQQQMNQALIDAEIAKWNFGQEEPYNRLNRYMALLSPGTAFNTVNATGTNQGSGGSALQGLMGLASTAGSLYSLFGGSGGGTTGTGLLAPSSTNGMGALDMFGPNGGLIPLPAF